MLPIDHFDVDNLKQILTVSEFNHQIFNAVAPLITVFYANSYAIVFLLNEIDIL